MTHDDGATALPQGDRKYTYLITLVATLGGFLFGFDTILFSGAQISLEKYFKLTPDDLGWAASTVLLGCVLGTCVAVLISDAIGRKKTMIFAGLLFAVSAVGTAVPNSIYVFNWFRFIGGLAIGIAMVISPVYIAEIAPRKIRGRLVTLNQIVIVSGAIIAVFISWVLAKTLPDEINWRWMFASECIFILGFVIGLLFIPESPRWLVEKDRENEARGILTRINGEKTAAEEVEEIQESIELEKERAGGGYRELVLPGVRMAMIVAVGLAVLQQFSGAMPLCLYAPIIFRGAGFTETEDAIGVTLFIFIWGLVCVLIVLSLVERVGRRPLLLGGMSAMAVGHLVLAYCFENNVNPYIMAVCLILTTGMSNLSISPLAWVILAEIFPTRIRGRAMGVATFVLYASSYCVTRYFPPVKGYFEGKYGTPSGIFIILAVICAVGVAFMWKMVPETKGKSLEEIANFWLRKH